MGLLPLKNFYTSTIVEQPLAPIASIGGTIAFCGAPIDNGVDTLVDPILIISQQMITDNIDPVDIAEIVWDENIDPPFWFLPLPSTQTQTVVDQQMEKIDGQCKTIVFSTNNTTQYLEFDINFDGVKVWVSTSINPFTETIQMKENNCLFSDPEVEGKAFYTFIKATATFPVIGKLIGLQNNNFTSRWQTKAQRTALKNAGISAYIQGIEGTQTIDVYIANKQAQVAYAYFAVQDETEEARYSFVKENKPYTNTSLNELKSKISKRLKDKLIDNGIIDSFQFNINKIESNPTSKKVKGEVNLGTITFSENYRVAYIELIIKGEF